MIRSCQDVEVKKSFAGSAAVVMPGPDPGIHHSSKESWRRGWIAGSSSAKTRFALLPGNDELQIKSQNFGGRHVRTAADRSCDISQGDPARSYRAGAGIFERARRQGAPDLETDRAGRKRLGADAH